MTPRLRARSSKNIPQRATSSQTRSYLDEAAEVVIVCDSQGRIIRASKSALHLSQNTPILGFFLADKFPLRTWNRKHLKLDEVLKGKIIHGLETTFKRKDGTTFYLILNARPLRNQQGRMKGCVITMVDITGRKRMEDALKESEEKARALLDVAPESAFLIDVKGNILDVNQTAAEREGKTPEELKGVCIYNVFPPEVVAIRKSWINQAVKKGVKVRFSDVCRQRNMDTLVHPILNIQGHVSHLALFSIDVTEKLRSEYSQQFLTEVSSMLAQALHYESTLDKIALLAVERFAEWCAITLLDPDGKPRSVAVQHADPKKVAWVWKAERDYSMDMNTKSGTPNVIRTGKFELYDNITDEMIVKAARDKKHLSLLRKLKMNSVIVVPLSSRGHTFGAISFVRSTASGRRYDKEDLLLAQAVAHRAASAIDKARLYKAAQEELRERKRVEGELRRSKKELEVIIQNVADGITVQDTEGRLMYANNAAAHLCGFTTAEEMLKVPPTKMTERFEIMDEFGNVVPPHEMPNRKALSGELVPQTILFWREKSMNIGRWSLLQSQPVLNDAGKIMFVINIFTDVTERRELEKRKDAFISMASHELKTPLTSLKVFTQLLHKLFTQKGEQEVLTYLSKMDIQLNKLTKLVTDLLDLSKIQTGKLDLEEQPFDFDVFMKETIENCQYSAQKHKIRLNGNTYLRIVGDKDRLNQVVVNIVDNACKYSPNADNVDVHVGVTDGAVLVSIKDHGVGIARQYQNKIFERFFRSGDVREKNFPGLGIGLYISSEIVRRHGGDIWVNSQEGKGSTFYFTLPDTRAVKPISLSVRNEQENSHS